MSTSRKYDSKLRTSRAADTRLRIQKATRKLITESGFDGTTVNAIAEEAGVSAQTIYSVFGSKAAIVASMLEHLEEEAGEAEIVKKLMAERNPRLQLEIFSEWITRLFDMSADVFSIVVQSPNEPALAEIRKVGDVSRIDGCKMLTGIWAEAGALTDNSAPDASAEQLWLLTSFETYLLCTRSLGWNSDRYKQWVTESAWRLLFR